VRTTDYQGSGWGISYFYRVTHMHSADYAVAGCPSVCLSHAGIESKRLHISLQFFFDRRSPTIHDFRPISHLISQMMQGP